MVNFGRKQVEIAVIVVPKVVVGATYLSMMASQLLIWADSSIASSRMQWNAEQSGCNVSAITELVDRLSQSDSVSTFNSLVRCGEVAVQPLISVLNDRRKDSLTRRIAARALSQIGSREAIVALLSVAQQRQAEIRNSALRAISDINPQAREAVPVLIQEVMLDDLDLSKAAMAALHRLDPAVPGEVISLIWSTFRGGNTERRDTVPSLLAQLDAKVEPAVSRLTQALVSRDEPTRAISAYVLVQLGRSAQSAIPALTEALSDESSSVRDTAACALARIGSREAITVLITQLKIGKEATQTSAAIGISSLTAEARDAIPVLITALRDDNERVRSLAAYALGEIGRESRRAIPALLGRLSDRSASVRGTAAHALGRIAPDDPRVIRLLVRQAASDADSTVRDSATESLGQITPEAASTLLDIFANQDQTEAEAAARLLLNLGSTIVPYLTIEKLPKILQGISHVPWGFPSNSYRIKFANYAFQQFGADIVPTLISSLNSSDEDIRVGATLALWIGYAEKYFDRQSIEPAIPTLTQTFRNSRLYTLWQSDNRTLVIAAAQGNPEAESRVTEIVFGDRVGLSALALLLWSDESFLDELKRENAIATKLVETIAFTIMAAGGGELVVAVAARNERPAICRVAFMQRFLWRCR